MARWGQVLIASVAMLLMTGCAHEHGLTTSESIRTIERLHLLLAPVALDLDGRPGPDGFGARIYTSNRKTAIGVPVADGTLELQMFDGVVVGNELKSVTPLRTWTFTPSELKSFVQKTSIGISYRFALAWGDKRPSNERITVVARYVNADGTEVYSAPGSIPLVVK